MSRAWPSTAPGSAARLARVRNSSSIRTTHCLDWQARAAFVPLSIRFFARRDDLLSSCLVEERDTGAVHGENGVMANLPCEVTWYRWVLGTFWISPWARRIRSFRLTAA